MTELITDRISIRPARIADAVEIANVTRSGIDPQLVGATIYGCEGIEHYIRYQIAARGSGADTVYTVACEEERIVGCVELRLKPGEIFLNYISVLPEMRSQGLGTRLLLAAIKNAGWNGREIKLDVFDENLQAKRWYERLGFRHSTSLIWQRIRPERATCASEAIVSDYPQACVCHERFGFGAFSVFTPSGAYRVGILGRDWFRITEESALSDVFLMSTLCMLDSNRDILAIVPEISAMQEDTHETSVIARSHRLYSNLCTLLNKLSHLVGI